MAKEQLFISKVKDIYRLNGIRGHLGWDQETIMPKGGAASRSDILSWLAAEVHKRMTDPELKELISELAESGIDQDLSSNVREMKREVDKALLLPESFVQEFAKARSEALLTWQKARQESDFSLFQSSLENLVEMTRKKIEYLPKKDTPYDTLLDEYEVGMTVADYDELFEGLRVRLVPLLAKIMEAKKNMSIPKLPSEMKFSEQAQTRFCQKVSEAMGFDFDYGRMDASTHPFSAGLWKGDTRFTTRFDEKDPFSCLYAVMHETGHALYEQGLHPKHSLTPRGSAISLGVHESQSRFWENQIGRTSEFWEVVLPWFKEEFPDSPDWTSAELNLIANQVDTSFIRVEADEVTYNLHIMLRYEIEKKIFNEGLEVSEIPKVWNQMFQDWFGITPSNDTEGCLQDIHWSMSAFGYFPTYTLGNLYASQLMNKIEEELGSVSAMTKSGDWSKMLAWLKEKIHEKGSLLTPSELIESATGKPPTSDDFLDYLEEKYGKLYSLS